jgi:hypothetical protein
LTAELTWHPRAGYKAYKHRKTADIVTTEQTIHTSIQIKKADNQAVALTVRQQKRKKQTKKQKPIMTTAPQTPH